MKKIVIFLIAIMLISTTFVVASNNPNQQNTNQKNDDNNSSDKGNSPEQNTNQVNVQQQITNQGNSSNLQTQQQTQLYENEGDDKTGTNESTQTQSQQSSSYQNTNTQQQQIMSTVQQKTQEVESSNGEMNQNQKMAQIAVQTMEATASMFGSAEDDISQISAQIMNSLEITFRAEEQINNRNGFVKFIAGGDDASAELIEQQTIRNEERIRELNRILQESNLDPQAKAVLQEQIQNIEQEQLRLKTLAEEQKNNKGLLGWLWK